MSPVSLYLYTLIVGRYTLSFRYGDTPYSTGYLPGAAGR
jgi:hypothetical protein